MSAKAVKQPGIKRGIKRARKAVQPAGEPVFEIWTGERGTAEARIYKIYADGRVEGFGDAPILINRLPKFIDRVVSEINKAQGAIVARVRREMGI